MIGAIASNYSEYGYDKYLLPEGVIQNTGKRNIRLPLREADTNKKEEEGLTPELKEAIVRYKKANPNANSGTILAVLKRQKGAEGVDRGDVDRVLNERNLDDNNVAKKKLFGIGEEDNKREEGIIRVGRQEIKDKERQNNMVANLSQKEGINLDSREKNIENTKDINLTSQEDRKVFKERAVVNGGDKEDIVSRETDTNRKDVVTPEIEQEIVRIKKANPEATASAIQKIVAEGENVNISVADVRKVLQKNDLLNDDKKSEEEKKSEKMLIRELTPEEKRQVAELKRRDAEVKAHEMAHIAAGGQYVRGAANYTYQKGPDGRRYAVGGEVSIDSGPEATPEETIRKAQIVRRAALAPADPSPSDRRIAAKASRMESEARAELAREKMKEAEEARKEGIEKEEETSQAEESQEVIKLEKTEEEEDSKISPELEREIVNKKKSNPNLDASEIKQILTQDGKEEISEAEVKRILQKNNLLEEEEIVDTEESESREEKKINKDEKIEVLQKEEGEESENVLRNILSRETENTSIRQKEEEREVDSLIGQKENITEVEEDSAPLLGEKKIAKDIFPEDNSTGEQENVGRGITEKEEEKPKAIMDEKEKEQESPIRRAYPLYNKQNMGVDFYNRERKVDLVA